MKSLKSILTISTLLLTIIFLKAQKIGVVDTNYILGKLPEYQQAEKRLNSQVKTWQDEAVKLQNEYDAQKTAFENEKVLLVGDQLKQREQKVKDLQTKLQDLISKKFGTDGEVNKLRVSLVRPFQDRIWNVINTMSKKEHLGIVIDKNSTSVLFLDKAYDYTDNVLNILLKNQGK
ncbi:OmpH family outer membrane protein [Riemerella columbipharyngis]|uniref:Outer membrane protein n=1 Tax=Riemerella columbipharyngis TaxID=1071918 RepID=A0A1G7CJA3_9FLAO|nr:OmpH family outer membrane protein [Riemerella columbipharyngis]SDE38756.1 outer membrane protein [Riemerella columbipharyngis]